jgi:hypothetical protein
MTYTWDANKNKTSESITGGMSGYGFTQRMTPPPTTTIRQSGEDRLEA